MAVVTKLAVAQVVAFATPVANKAVARAATPVTVMQLIRQAKVTRRIGRFAAFTRHVRRRLLVYGWGGERHVANVRGNHEQSPARPTLDARAERTGRIAGRWPEDRF